MAHELLKTKRQIILASTSPRRKALLEQIGLEFSIVPSDYEEDMTLDMPPAALAAHLAGGKATAVAEKHPEAIVIGSDSIVVLDGQLLGKPKSAEEARQTLKRLSGKKNEVMTGICVICAASGQKLVETSTTSVYFRELTDEEIDAYVASGQPLDKAGSYAIQDRGAVFIDRIDGDYNTVVGLPLTLTWQLLQKFA